MSGTKFPAMQCHIPAAWSPQTCYCCDTAHPQLQIKKMASHYNGSYEYVE